MEKRVKELEKEVKQLTAKNARLEKENARLEKENEKLSKDKNPKEMKFIKTYIKDTSKNKKGDSQVIDEKSLINQINYYNTNNKDGIKLSIPQLKSGKVKELKTDTYKMERGENKND